MGGVFTGQHRPYFEDISQRSPVQDVTACINTYGMAPLARGPDLGGRPSPWSESSNGLATVQGTDGTYTVLKTDNYISTATKVKTAWTRTTG